MMIAPYITTAEYACKCCDGLPPDLQTDPAYQVLFNAFKDIREEWGNPIKITSGYRCPMHNSMVGGSALSVHQWGLALDMDCKDVDEVYELEFVIENLYPQFRRGRYADSGSFIHIDVAYLIHPRASHAWVVEKRWTG
jgi:uncharacterized protein YcbK (DUF882 family)